MAIVEKQKPIYEVQCDYCGHAVEGDHVPGSWGKVTVMAEGNGYVYIACPLCTEKVRPERARHSAEAEACRKMLCQSCGGHVRVVQTLEGYAGMCEPCGNVYRSDGSLV